jgi:TctA family transporter
MPANDNLNITFSASENNTYNYTISNMVGATVYTNSVDAVAGENKLAVDVSNLTNGVYFLNINRGDASLTKKIIISH